MPEIINFQSKKTEESGLESEHAKAMETDARSYSSDEVADIIRTALRNADTDANTVVDHRELLSIGRDFGLAERTLTMPILSYSICMIGKPAKAAVERI